jgi:hypothetical protein
MCGKQRGIPIMEDSKIHELLNLSWGGAGYPSYEGRLEDDGAEPMDSQERVEAAMAAFSGNDPDPNAADPNADPGARAADPNAADPNADPNAADPNAGQLTDEQRNADPVFKELTEAKAAIDAVFDKHNLVAAAESNGRTPHEEADLQLADANILYQIMRGERTPSNLLDTMANVGKWQQGQRDAVASDLMAWLTKAGYLKDGQAAAGADGKKPAGKAGDPGFRDPMEERLNKLESANEKAAREQQERTQQVEKNRVGKVFIDHVEKLCGDNAIAKEDMPFYASQVAALVNGNKAITDRVAKGNFVDIKKFFDTVHSRELQRLDRYNKAQLNRQANKAKNPKSPAGGAPGAPAAQAKRSFANRDERIAAATEAFQS